MVFYKKTHAALLLAESATVQRSYQKALTLMAEARQAEGLVDAALHSGDGLVKPVVKLDGIEFNRVQTHSCFWKLQNDDCGFKSNFWIFQTWCFFHV